jgi:hypothetical protein
MDGFLEEFHLPAIDIIGGLITKIKERKKYRNTDNVCVCAKGMRKKGEGK